MIGKHQINAIKQLILDLIPTCTVSYTQRSPQEKDKLCRLVSARTGEKLGLLIKEDYAELWIEANDNGRMHTFIISRKGLTFTKTEIRILNAVLDVCRSNTIDNEIDAVFTQQSISSQFTMPYFIVSNFMRGANHACLWSSVIGLVLLQKLSYKKYEGSMCSSGFLCLKSINNTIQERIKTQSTFVFEAFDKPIPLSDIFFDKPLSYRYVDGRNSFYLVDNHETVLGVLRNNSPKNYDIIDRCTFKHIESLTSLSGFRWLAYSGIHSDIIVHTKKGIVFQWDQGIWRNRELSLIEKVILKYGVEVDFAKMLVDTLYTLSELRSGALILLIRDEKLPEMIGKIDTTKLGTALCKSLKGSSFNSLRTNNSIIGLLTSDGMTTFDVKGNLIDCGTIIDLSTVSETARVAGGGRSQAACAASTYGLAIKVSEDGPITIYENGTKTLEWS